MSFQRMTIIGSIPRLEQRRERLADLAVAVVLQPVDLHREVADVPERAQARDRVVHLAAGLVQDPGELLRLVHRRLDAVQREVVGDLLDEVDDVVERGGEVEDVLSLDRRHERVVEALDDVVRDPVALLLADHDLARELAVVGPAVEHLSRISPDWTMLRPASSNRSKNSRSRGANRRDRPAIGGPV